MPDTVPLPACGLLNGMYGEEIMLASNSKSFIFNLKRQAWRFGPPLPEPIEALGYAQVHGGFLALAGEMDETFNLQNAIYKFDESTNQWIILEQRQDLARNVNI